MGLCQSDVKDVLPSLSLESGEVDVDQRIRRSKVRRFPLASSKATKVSDLKEAWLKEEISGSIGGDCLVFLEQAHFAALSTGNLSCQAGNAASSFSVATSATKDGAQLGEVVEWPVRRNKAASWFSARNLGFNLADHVDASLHLQLKDGSRVLGELTTPLKDLDLHESVTLQLPQQTSAEGVAFNPSVTFQILDSKAVLRRRIVYLVRHGESQWNKAQSKLDLQEMAKKTDHPLSAKGRDQAVALAALLQAELKKDAPDPSLKDMLQPGAVFSSPLGRALQTAVLTLGPVLGAEGTSELPEFVVQASAKEKQNLGGFDTHCTKIGREILDSVRQELKVLCADQAQIMETFGRLFFDLEEVQQGPWWPEGQMESSQQLQVRLREFMLQLQYSSCDSIVVFGHSLFFQQILKRYLSEDLRKKDPILARDLGQGKLSNCGVVRLELDPWRKLEDGPFVEAKLVLNTTVSLEGSAFTACCNAPENLRTAELAIETTAAKAPGTEDVAKALDNVAPEAKIEPAPEKKIEPAPEKKIDPA